MFPFFVKASGNVDKGVVSLYAWKSWNVDKKKVESLIFWNESSCCIPEYFDTFETRVVAVVFSFASLIRFLSIDWAGLNEFQNGPQEKVHKGRSKKLLFVTCSAVTFCNSFRPKYINIIYFFWKRTQLYINFARIDSWRSYG